MVQNSYLSILHTNYMINITRHDHQSWINVTQEAFVNRKGITPTFNLLKGKRMIGVGRGNVSKCKKGTATTAQG